MICSLVQFDVWHTVCAIESTEQLQCGAEAASEMQQKIGRLKHSWSHDDAGGAELGGASANVDDGDHGGIYIIVNICLSSADCSIFICCLVA